jgi:hypothetical protein
MTGLRDYQAQAIDQIEAANKLSWHCFVLHDTDFPAATPNRGAPMPSGQYADN